MHAFLVAEDFTLHTTRFTRRYLGGSLQGEVPIDRLVIDIGAECDMVRKAMEQDYKNRHAKDEVIDVSPAKSESSADAASIDQAPGSESASGADELPKLVTTVQEGQLLAWPKTPPRLGRVSSRVVQDAGLFRHPDEGDVLKMQIEALKARHPHKKHFRIAVVNAFGTNLGDTILGMTALRYVAKYLQQYMDSVVIDLLLGATAGVVNFDIAGHDEWVGDQYLLGPTLQEFARYDAYFDFTGLIALPRITEMAISDWYLWWCGLDPAAVPASDKRNIMYHQWPVWQEVSRVLQGIKGRKVFFNPKASVPLRTFADDHVAKFLKRLLKLAPDLTVVVDREIKLTHPRLVNLSKEINSAGKFAALVAQMDGMISVDSFALHAADCASVPSVGLFASIDPSAYPYYPHHQGVLIPDGEKLPAYKRFKTNTDEEWDEIKDVYAEAWGRLDAQIVLNILQEKMKTRGSVPGHNGTRMVYGQHQRPRFKQTGHGRVLPYETVSPVWQHAQTRMQEIAKSLLRGRSQAILVTPGQSPLAVAVAQHMEREGRLHIFEPRDARRHLIAIDVMERAANGVQVRYHDTFPGLIEEASFPLEEALSETNPATWGSLQKKKSVKPVSIDGMELDVLSCIMMSAPAPWKHALESGLGTVERLKPAILVGPISSFNEIREMATMLLPVKYQCWVEQLEPGKSEASIVLAVNDQIKVQGLKRVQFS